MLSRVELDALVEKTAREASAQVASKAHVAYCAEQWLTARRVERTFMNDLDALKMVAGPLSDTEVLFWEVVRQALATNAAIPDSPEEQGGLICR